MTGLDDHGGRDHFFDYGARVAGGGLGFVLCVLGVVFVSHRGLQVGDTMRDREYRMQKEGA
jgi:hypothetical protein